MVVVNNSTKRSSTMNTIPTSLTEKQFEQLIQE